MSKDALKCCSVCGISVQELKGYDGSTIWSRRLEVAYGREVLGGFHLAADTISDLVANDFKQKGYMVPRI